MTAFEKQCEETAKYVDDLSDSEKKFILWLLLNYYKDGLLDDIQFEPKDAADYRSMEMMRFHIKACEQMRECIGYEIF